MRDGWVERAIGDITECSWGNTGITKSKYIDSGYLAYSASGADGFLEWFEHDRSAVILSAIGAQCGKTWFAEGKWTAIKNTIWLKSDNNILLDEYLFYLSNREHFWQIRGQAQPFISLGDVKKTKVSLPPILEQKRIVDLISSVDSYSAALERQLESAKKSRNAVLHELLTAGVDGWVETTLDEIADVTMGQSPNGKSYNVLGEGLPFMQGSAEFGEHYPTPEKWCSDPKKIAEPGDLLLSVRAPVGDTNFADQRIAVGRGLSIIRANEKSVTEFIRLVIQLNVSAMISSSGTGMFSSITGKNLRDFKVIVPPLSEQTRIVEIISSIDLTISELRNSMYKSAVLRSGLLSDLLSGNHEIPSTYDEIMDAA